MKPCPYCGRENADEAVYCRECGSEFPRPGESATTAGLRAEEPTGAMPVFGWLSVSAPFIGAFVVYVGCYEMGSDEALWFIPVTPLFGIACAVTAWARGERHLALRWIGILFALGVVGWIINALINLRFGC